MDPSHFNPEKIKNRLIYENKRYKYFVIFLHKYVRVVFYLDWIFAIASFIKFNSNPFCNK